MKGYSKKYLPLIVGVACAIGVLLGSVLDFSQKSTGFFETDIHKAKLARLIDYIKYEYVDDVNTDSIVNLTINRILSSLDPHSVYIPKEEYALISRNMQGDFVGIGIKYYKIKDTVSISQTIENSPADRVGILGGDKLLYANGVQVYGRNLKQDSLAKILNGPKGSELHLKIYRETKDSLIEFKLKRGLVSIKSVVSSYVLCADLGYIKINRFAATTAQEFHNALQELKDKGITALVLDLRDNGGGYLEEAVAIADEFLSDEKLIVSTKNNSGKTNKTFATEKGSFEKGKLFVLINENSASASEILAGALQDNDKGSIIGRRSFGKGLVQREMELGDGSVVRLTVARYYTPTGRSIQRSYAEGKDAYFNNYLNRYANGELVNADSIEVKDSLRFYTPEGKVVYGGGGIIPDIFIPKDISTEKNHLDYFLRTGLIARFVFNELQKNRQFYNQLEKEKFIQEIQLGQAIISDFMAYLKKMNIHFQLRTHKDVLKKYIKACMAEQLFGSNIYFQLINQHDVMIQKAKALNQCTAAK